MGLFSKNKKEEAKPKPFQPIPSLPKLPDFPRLDSSGYGSDYDGPAKISKLPSFPSNSLGTRFSQDTIKEAVTGDEEGDMGNVDDSADDTDEDNGEMRMMRNPMMRRPVTEEMGSNWRSPQMPSTSKAGRSTMEPVFIRIDKFEDAMKVFNEMKHKVSEVERVLEDIKSMKEKEDTELKSWENELKSMKDQISKVDADIFSRI